MACIQVVAMHRLPLEQLEHEQLGTTGSPLFDDCRASLECRVFSRYDTGDRCYFWAHVVAGEKQGDGQPLCEQGLIAAASDDQRSLLGQNRREDAELLRPLHNRWPAVNLLPTAAHPK
jgi:flavin reductase (DIM6/NTAB) family NADH-FMN oxidoreductase RutF